MKPIAKYILLSCTALVAANAMAQELNSAYFTKDYKFRHDMNPAFGNDNGYFAMPILGNLNAGVRGNLNVDAFIFDNPLGNGYSKTTFMNPEIPVDKALAGFNKGKNILLEDLNLTVLSLGFKAFGGYNTMSVNVKERAGLSLPYDLFAFMKNVGNKTYQFDDMALRAQAYGEVAFGHSRNIGDKLRIGAKVKIAVGAGYGNIDLKDVKVDMTNTDQWTVSGNAKGELSVGGLELKSERKDYEAKSGSYDYVNDADFDSFKLSGFGFLFDLGAIYKVTDDITVSAAITDLGTIRWDNTHLLQTAVESFTFNGFQNVSVNEDRDDNTLEKQLDRYGDDLADFAHLKDMGDQGARSVGVGATARLGVEYTLPTYKALSFGALGTRRFNGPMSWTEGRVSANYAPFNWLDGGVNFAASTFTTSVGWVLNIHPKAINIYVGMDHLVGKTSKQFVPLTSNANLSLGMSITW
mgnify:CR=1 FL=1